MSASARLRRIEVITGVERRRKWSAQAKAEIAAESLAEGAIVSEVARRHGLSPEQLFSWRARLRDTVTGSASQDGPTDDVSLSEAAPVFVPAVVESGPPSLGAQALPASVAARGCACADPEPIEIALGLVIVRVRGQADPRTLTAVLKALQVRP